MEWLNYHHLLYFWAVAKHGSVAQASRELRLSHPTVSAQIHRLEHVLGEKLFAKQGRGLVLTETGRVAFRYADEIFSLGREFLDTIRGRPIGRPIRVVVGCSDALPKSVVQRILAPAWRLEEHVRVVCREGNTTQAFLGELVSNSIDVVLADTPAPPGSVRAFSHLLGECGTTFLASPALAKLHKRRFPKSLMGAPFLLPGGESMLRRNLEQWLDAREIRPRVVGEFDDPALSNVVAEAGLGVFAVPTVIAEDIPSTAPLGVGRQRGRASAPILRHLGRAQDQKPRGGCHLRGRAARHLPRCAGHEGAAQEGRRSPLTRPRAGPF